MPIWAPRGGIAGRAGTAAAGAAGITGMAAAGAGRGGAPAALARNMSKNMLPVLSTRRSTGAAGLADALTPGELSGEGLLHSDGPLGADGSAPAAMNAPGCVDDRLSLHLQAAVLVQPPVRNLNAALRTDINAQAAMNAILVYCRGLHCYAQVGRVLFRLARCPDLQCPGGADAGTEGA